MAFDRAESKYARPQHSDTIFTRPRRNIEVRPPPLITLECIARKRPDAIAFSRLQTLWRCSGYVIYFHNLADAAPGFDSLSPLPRFLGCGLWQQSNAINEGRDPTPPRRRLSHPG
jgi:hypothetical protein